MSLIPIVYRSTDPGAPVLNGQAGSLLAVLHAVLVAGYGSGATAKPGAGWTRPYSNSGVHVYRNSPLTGSGAYMRVCDDGSAATLSTPRLGQVWAYSSMSSIDTGADQTPNPSMQARGSFIAKSLVASATACPWMVVATEIGFYLFVGWHNFPDNGMGAYYYGDLLSSVPGDPFPFVCFGSSDISSLSSYGTQVCTLFYGTSLELAVGSVSIGTSYVPGAFVMRSYSGGAAASGRVAMCTVPSSSGSATTLGNGAYSAAPDPAHGGYNYVDAVVREAAHAIRGLLPGVLGPLHARPHVPGSIVPYIEGKGLGQWLVVKYNVANPSQSIFDGQVLFRLDLPWK